MLGKTWHIPKHEWGTNKFKKTAFVCILQSFSSNFSDKKIRNIYSLESISD